MASLDDYRKQELLKRAGINMYSNGPFTAASKQMPAQNTGPGLIQRAFPNMIGAMNDRRSEIDAARQTGGLGAAVGQSIRTSVNPLIGLMDDYAGGAKRLLDPAAQAAKTAFTGDATPIGQSPLVAAAAKNKAPQPLASYSNEGRSNAASMPAPSQPSQAQAQSNPLVSQIAPGIYRQGNSYGDSPQAASEFASNRPVSAQNMAAADALAQRYTNPLVQAAQPQQQVNQNLTPADNGQGTGYGLLNSNRIAQRNAMMDVQQLKPGAGRSLIALLQQQSQGTQNALEREQMAQRGQESAADRLMRGQELTARLGESAADRALRGQEVADNALVNAAKREAMGVETGAAKQLADLRNAYLNAKTPEEQAAAAAKLNALAGKVQQDEYMAVGGGESVIDNMGNVVKNPDVLVNKRTGQPVQGQQARPAQADGAPVTITGDADFDALPSGAIYIGPDGKKYRKP